MRFDRLEAPGVSPPWLTLVCVTAAAQLLERDASVSGGCFLCEPAPDLVYSVSENFFAMLGLGPISEGYSLIAAREHVTSMLDLPTAQRSELVEFTRQVRGRLGALYGPIAITEHGRVPPCLDRHVRAHEAHCLHAHRLVFPNASVLDLTLAPHGFKVQTYGSFIEAAADFRDTGQYLYTEGPDGGCQLASVCGPFPRQFFRRLVARAAHVPELSDWQAHPRLELIAEAHKRLASRA